jgi:hypothetical protein
MMILESASEAELATISIYGGPGNRVRTPGERVI